MKMKAADFIFMAFALLMALFISFEMGKKNQCERDANYIYELDYGRCMFVGKDNVK